MKTTSIQALVASLVISLSLFLLIGCSKEDKKETPANNTPATNLHWVNSGVSSMPVYISGNEQSDVVLLLIHGGPGGSSLEFLSGFEQSLGQSFQIVTWDQCYSGFSKFDVSSEPLTMTIESNLRDCDLVVDFLKNRYPNKKIVIWGQSWGGAIVSGYASHPAYHAKIDGWIVVNGTVSGFEWHRSMWEFAVRRCNEKITEGFGEYGDSLAWLTNNAYVEGEVFDRDKLIRIAIMASGLWYEGEPEASEEYLDNTRTRVNQIFPASADRDRYLRNVELEVNDISTSAEMHAWRVDVSPMSKPGLLIWGEKDETCPIELLDWYTGVLSAQGKEHTVRIYPNEWHTPFVTNQAEHDADVRAFLEGL